jgi:ApeA N-terminal domain 1
MEPKRFVGNWWLPGSPDRAVGGVLEVDSASSRLRLELTDRLLEQGPAAERTPMIYGAANGREITLLESMPANGGHTTIAQVTTTTQVVRPRVALVGIRLDDPRQEVFDGLKTSMTGLTAWASRSGLDHDWIATPDTDARSQLTVRWTDPLETQLDEPPETLGLHWEISSGFPTVTAAERRFHATERVVLQVHSSKLHAWDGFLKRSKAVRDLVTVATQQPSRVFEHELLIDRAGPMPIPYTVGLYFHGIERSAEHDDGDTVEALFTVDGANFGSVMHDWFTLRDKIGLPLDVLLGLEYDRGGYYENRLFNAAAAAEGSHTALFPDSTGLPPAAHESVVRRVASALYYALKEHRDWAISKIKDNRPGLKDRLVELVTKADGDAVHSLLTDVDIWAKWLKNARNAIGHLNTGELEEKVPLEEARFRLESVTRAVLHLIILAELGLSGEDQRQVVFEKWRYAADRFGEAVAEANQ